MPTLNWIGKEAVVNHHQQAPFHLLRDVPELACGQPGDGNLVVQGNNLIALKALLPYYAGQVQCIYIDPPYNTGNEGWVYNDNVNSPIIREWLGKAVGKEGETLDRHRPKMTQTQLAEAVGVSQASVAAWESGETQNLSSPNLLKAAEVLGVSSEWLDCGVGPGPGEAQRAVLQRQPNLEKEVVELALTIQALSQPRREALKQLAKLLAE